MTLILERGRGAGVLTARPMFGEYGLYCNGKLVGLVCDGRLFLKPTVAGRAYPGVGDEAPPYPGAKPHLLIQGDPWEDGAWLAGLLRVTAAALPARKPKRG